ncbi:hypothetical protein HDU93_005000 [Gonapodya sp. JEL0774]|nr:hypothetical protein HDU93_005000 [Gonapodya sp. JEL0774]
MSPIRTAGADAAHAKSAGVVSPLRPASAGAAAKSPLAKSAMTAHPTIPVANKSAAMPNVKVHSVYPPPPNLAAVIASKVDRITAGRVIGELIARRALRVENLPRLDAVNAAKKLRAEQWADANKKLEPVLRKKVEEMRAGGPSPSKRVRDEENDGTEHAPKRVRKDSGSPAQHVKPVSVSPTKVSPGSPMATSPATPSSPSGGMSDPNSGSGRKSSRKASAKAQDAMKDQVMEEADEDEGTRSRKRSRK